MRIAIAGASGFIGSALKEFLLSKGHEIFSLVRHPAHSNKEIYWNPVQRKIESEKLANCDVVINLAGENISSGLWTRSKKRAIHSSRILATSLLVESLNQQNPNALLISASAVGYYGYDCQKPRDESCPAGQGFLAKVCQEWEAEAVRYQGPLAITRFGIVLSPRGGVLAKMIPAFKKGLGAILGDGKQWISWIALEDLIQIIYKIIQDNSLRGIFNVCAPDCITQEQLAQKIAKQLNVKVRWRIPASLLHLILGQMAKETLLASQCAQPKRLLAQGYYFPPFQDIAS